MLELQEYLLGDDCILSSFTVNLIGPASQAGRWHYDSPPLGSFPAPLPSCAFCANTIYVLDDFTPQNFCRSFTKPQQDMFRLAQVEVVERATPTLKRLLGFDAQSGMRT